MTKEELKAMGLTEDQADKIFEDYGKNYVPKSQFNEKLEALKHAEEDKKNAAKELDELKKQHEGDEDLKKQIEDLQNAAKERDKKYAADMNQLKLDTAIEKALTAAKVRSVKAARAMMDLSDAKLNDKGEVEGLAEKIAALQKSDGYLFESGEKKLSGLKPGEVGDEGGGTSAADIFAKALG